MEAIMTVVLFSALIIGIKNAWLGSDEKDSAYPLDLNCHKRFENRFLG